MNSYSDVPESDSESVNSCVKRSKTNEARNGPHTEADRDPTPAKKPRIALGSTPLYRISSSATPLFPETTVSDVLIKMLFPMVFLVGALSFQGKMPDYSSDFFLQTTLLTLIGPPNTILKFLLSKFKESL